MQRAHKPWVSTLSNLVGYDDDGSVGSGFYTLALLVSFVGLSFGCLVTIVFLGADCWRAFKQRKHWIPGDSLIFGALAMQLLTLLNKPSLDFSFNDNTNSNLMQYACEYLNVLQSKWVLILIGRVSTCVLMGCLLPGVATPLSPNLTTDLAALFISFALVSVYITSHEIFILPTAYKIPGYVLSLNDASMVYKCLTDPWNTNFMESTNVIVLVSMVTLALLLGCAASASIGIHDIVSRKIPVLFSSLNLSPRLYPPEIRWEKIEEQVLKSWIVVRTSNPQYIISRSVLSASVAFIITVCNAVLVFEMARCSYKATLLEDFAYASSPQGSDVGDYVYYYHEGCVRPPLSIPLILHYMVIFLGSAVIYCRCVTAAVYYPRDMRWNSVRRFWKIEAFWLSHLLDSKDSLKWHGWEIGGESYPTKVVIARLLRSVRLYRLLSLIVWLQMSLVFFSKGCWLLSQLFFSNNLFRKIVVDSAFEGIYSSNTERTPGETQLEGDPAYNRYRKTCVAMQGENAAGLWIANNTSIQALKRRFRKGEEEGKICHQLIALLVDKSSTGFNGQRCLQPGLPLGLELESELNVSQRSSKMTAVTILSLIFELSPFIHNEGETNIMTDKAIKACSQAWNIMDAVEYSESEAAGLITASDELLQKLEEERKWLDRRLPMSDSAEERSLEAAKAAVENMFERGKEVANGYNSRAWEEVAAACSMCRLCRSIINDYEFNSVEGVLDKLEGALADVIGSCIAKAGQVIAEDCKKWATNLEEERIWKAGRVIGKVRAITEKTGLILERIPPPDISQRATATRRHYFKWYEKFPSMA